VTKARRAGWLARPLAAALLCACASHLGAQSADTASKAGRRLIGVFDGATGAPIAGVQVRDVFNDSYTSTGVEGIASISWLSYRGMAGMIDLRKVGYEEKRVFVSRDDTVSITVTLDRIATLGPMITSERYRIDRDDGRWSGFETRCQTGSATCFRAEDLAKYQAGNLADVIMHARGVTIGACGGPKDHQTECGRIAMRSLTIPPSYCQPTFFVDGHEWGTRAWLPTDVVPGHPPEAPLIPSNVKAIEVYPPERAKPLRFVGNPVCGSVVIWTK
jgi:hypothetical protein